MPRVDPPLLALGARRRQHGVPALIVEKNARPGDSWRKRYKSLCLHDPVWYDHLPYIKFPENWPVFSPKDKIGDWLEMYAKVMELNFWGAAEAKRASYDATTQTWAVEVERDGDKIIVRLAERGSFRSGYADLQQGFKPLLNKVGASISNAVGLITIEGHTDNVPMAFSERFRSNWDLSAARSAAVADYLLNNSNLEDGRVTVTGFADTKPLASNDTAAGRSKNRRIEVIIDGQ